MKVETYAGVMDVVSAANEQNAVLVLPTLRHAIALWPRYREAFKDRHGPLARMTKTAVALGTTGTTLRLWVPYARDPSMPMDHPLYRTTFAYYITPFDKGVMA